MAGYAAWDVSITAEGNDIYEKYRTGQIVLTACIVAVCMFSNVHGAEAAGPPAPKTLTVTPTEKPKSTAKSKSASTSKSKSTPKSKSALTQKPEATPIPASTQHQSRKLRQINRIRQIREL